MRIPVSEHRSHHWRIEGLAPDFRLEDAWALPVTGGAGDFATLLELMGSLDVSHGGSRATRLLFAIRYMIGDLFGWDDAGARLPIPGDRKSSLKERLPEDLRYTADPDLAPRGFTPLYRTGDEWAAELSNRTVHGVIHLAWVEGADGRHRGQMGIYVKPRGTLGVLYMAAIAPFRHHIVYPALMRQIEQAWTERVVHG